MKKILYTLLLCFVTLPALAEKTILIVGDSISAGYGLDVQQGWVHLLQNKLRQEKFPYQVMNASISGDTTSNGLARMPMALQQSHPAITIIELGGNDGLRGLSIATITDNLTKMVLLAKQAGSKVLLLGIRMPPNYGPQYTQQFQELFVNVAEQNAVKLVPDFLAGMEANPQLFQADNIHPTTEAQPILLNTVWSELKKLLTTRPL